MWLVALAILGAIIVRLVVGVQTVDDAFITFRYSQHIAAGEGFTYNSPQRVLGTSTPLFTLVMALAARAGLDLPVSSFVVSLFADVVSLALVAAMLIRLGYLLAAGLACACRPDGVLIAGVVAVAALWALPRRSAIRICALSAAVVLPWVLFATREDMYRAVAVTLAQSDGHCAIAATEIGVLGYYYPGAIVDLVGLVTPEAIGRSRSDTLKDSAACWLVTYDDHLFKLDQNAMTLPWFQREFTLIDRIEVGPTRAFMVYQRANARPRTPYQPVQR